MALKRFCPKCGKITEDLFGSLCKECFLETVELLRYQKRMRFSVCPDCGKARFNKLWSDYNSREDLIKTVVLRYAKPLQGAKISFSYPPFSIRGKTEVSVDIAASLSFGRKKIEKTAPMLLVILPEICPSCSRRRGGYYEAIVQFRGDAQKSEAAKKYFEAHISDYLAQEPLSFITKKEALKEGADFYVGSRKAAIWLASEIRKIYNIEITITHKIAGMRKGKEIKRTTILLRG